MLGIDVLRWITVRALKGQTWAGNNVFDSPATVADLRIAEQRQPFIAVFCDECDTEGMDNPSTIGPMNVRLIIETGVASSIVLPMTGAAGAPEAPVSVTMLNDTDPALEATIGFLAEQARDALMDTVSPWADLWRELTGGQMRKVECVRGGPATDQYKPPQRYASRIQIYHTGVLAVPPRGAPLEPNTFWPHFLALAAADPELAGIGQLVQAHFEYPAGSLPVWRLAEKYLGVSAATVRGLNIAPLDGFVTEEPVAPIGGINLSERFGHTPAPPGEDLQIFPTEGPDAP